MKQKGDDFCSLGQWCSTLFYSDPTHRTRVVAVYNVGRQSPKGLKTIYLQQVRHIQTHQLNTSPSWLFLMHFLAQLQVWQCQGDRLLIFMDMNEHVLCGTVACHLLSMGLVEMTHQHWGAIKPHTFIGGVDPINQSLLLLYSTLRRSDANTQIARMTGGMQAVHHRVSYQ